jgi:prepilin-type N-terminal cleavage/methylation domain-containing protein
MKITIRTKGFTLIELLVVISIIGILVGLSIFGLQSARKSSRNSRRKADLELIRSGVEIYKADCGSYPVELGSSLSGSETSGNTCLTSIVYIAEVPTDLLSSRSYYYSSPDGVTYELCAALEDVEETASCGGSCGEICNYQVVNP